MFYIVNIGGYDFALNGIAQSKFGLPSVRGAAILGKSVGPFNKMAAELSASPSGAVYVRGKSGQWRIVSRLKSMLRRMWV